MTILRTKEEDEEEEEQVEKEIALRIIKMLV